MKGELKVSTEAQVDGLYAALLEGVKAGNEYLVKRLTGKRSLDQNAMSFALYTQIAMQCEDQSIEDIRRQCKLDIGVPILSAEDSEFGRVFAASVGLLPYEDRLIMMKSTDVTRKLSKRGFAEYIDNVVRVYSQQGYALVHPSQEAA